MKRLMPAWPSLVALVVLGVYPASGLAQSMDALSWRPVRAPFLPDAGVIAGGPGDAPEPGSPMFICRTSVGGSLAPGKWIKGNCNVAYGGREIVAENYEIAYGHAVWRTFGNRNQRDLIQTGLEADGTPLYSCRVRYRAGGRDLGFQPGKIVAGGTCNIPFGGREIEVLGPFEALYAGKMGTPAVAGGWNGARPRVSTKLDSPDFSGGSKP